MAFDGITVAALRFDLQNTLSDGRIAKVAQPEKDEILLTVKTADRTTVRVLISASASLPLVYLTQENKTGPMQAPNFCMLLRKYISGGRIINVEQPGFERILIFRIEHRNELGDLCTRLLITELMGKHSNIILCDENNVIIDAVKHVSALVSSVREVLPGRPYFIANTMEKENPLTTGYEQMERLLDKPCAAAKAIYTSYTGISPLFAQELCFRAGIDPDLPFREAEKEKKERLAQCFARFSKQIEDAAFSCALYKRDAVAFEFSALPLSMYEQDSMITKVSMPDISSALTTYFREKALFTRMREKSSSLSHIVSTALARSAKKYDLQMSQLADTKDREKYKQYGELLHTYGYDLPPGSKKMEVINYYTGEPVCIPLDPTKDFRENAARFFEKYNKKKRTYEALSVLSRQTKDEMDYLASVKNALSIASSDEDLAQIYEELSRAGIVRKKHSTKKRQEKSSPLHYETEDGYHIYVGKNNLQNEWITFTLAEGNDWWFHVKDAPGSHVVVKADNKELPDHVFEDAGRLAAYYSTMRGSDKIEIDYVQKKHVKKPKGSPPGFVVYYTNYSLIIDSDISGLRLLP